MPLVAAEAVERSRLLRPDVDRAQATARHGVSLGARAVHQPRRRGGGRQVDPARRAGRRARGARARRCSSRASRAAAPAPRRSARCCWRATRTRWSPRAEALLFAAARADHVDKTIRPALDRGAVGAERPLPRSARSPIRARRAGSGSRRCASSTASAATTSCPTAPGAEPRRGRSARRGRGCATASAGDRIGSRPPSYHAAVDAGFRADRREGAGAGQAGRRQRLGGDGHRALALRAGRPAAVIVGQDQAVGAVPRRVEDAAGCTMPGCSPGRAGVGKASFAARRRCACWPMPPGRWRGTGLDVPDDHPIAQLVAAGSHPDLRLLERARTTSGDALAPQHQRRPGARARPAARRDHRRCRRGARS